MKGTVLRKSVHPYVEVIPDEGLRLIKKNQYGTVGEIWFCKSLKYKNIGFMINSYIPLMIV